LIAADIGIAIGSGSESLRQLEIMGKTNHFFAGDVAVSSASFILLSSNLQSLLTLSDLSRKVFDRVKFNFVSAKSIDFRPFK